MEKMEQEGKEEQARRRVFEVVRRNIGETDTDVLLVFLFPDESLRAASSEGGVEGEGSFFAREGGMKKR